MVRVGVMTTLVGISFAYVGPGCATHDTPGVPSGAAGSGGAVTGAAGVGGNTGVAGDGHVRCRRGR